MMAQEQEKLGTTTLQPQKVALVIGNQNYLHLRSLQNTLNDAYDMKSALEKLGFKVTLVKDADLALLITSVEKFMTEISPNALPVLFFSGHGIGYHGKNYLLPINASIKCLEDIEKQSLSLDYALYKIGSKSPIVNLAFIDACRNLPGFQPCQSNSKELVVGPIKPSNVARGTFITFATQEGKTALEFFKDRNSLFTSELLHFITNPSLSIRTIIDSTTNIVERKSNGRQIPNRYDELRGDFLLSNGLKITNQMNIETIVNVSNSQPEITINTCEDITNKKCKNESGFLMTNTLGIGLDENDAIEDAQHNTQLELFKTLLDQLSAIEEIKKEKIYKDGKYDKREEVFQKIEFFCKGKIAGFQRNCYTVSSFISEKGQKLYKCNFCGKIPIEPNLVLLENDLLKNSTLSKDIVKRFIQSLRESLESKK